MNDSTEKQLISLKGDGYAVGYKYGELVQPFLKEALKQVSQNAFEKNGTLSKQEYTKKYLSILEEWMPYCLEELTGMSKALNITLEEVALWNSCRYAPPDIDNCTSWIVMPDISECESVILHKNRDGGGACQSFLMKQVENNLKWFGPVDIPCTSPLFGVNEKGVAVAMNNGEPCKENNPVGLTTPDILRLLMDRAHDANEAVEIFKEIVAKKHYAHHKNGSIFLTIDPKKAFIAENTANRCFSEEIKAGFAVRSNDWRIPEMKKYALPSAPDRMACDSSRFNRVTDLLESFLKKGKVGIRECQVIGKDRKNSNKNETGSAISKESTSFAITAMPALEQPELFSVVSVTMGHPTCSCSIPFCTGVDGVPGLLADSSLTQKTYELCKKIGHDSIEKINLLSKENELMELFLTANKKAHSLKNDEQIIQSLNESFDNLSKKAFDFFDEV
jgi:acyl-CoA:6-aminopenicillanic acid acyl transferase